MCLVARMPPVVSLDMPSWLLWKRHTWNIKATADNAMWLKSIGVKALETNGAADANDSQTKLIATRVLSSVRAQHLADVKQSLASLFKLGLDTEPLHDFASDFWNALTVIMHRLTFPLKKRITLLKEAKEFYMEEAESHLWSAVTASPRGRDVLDDVIYILDDGKPGSGLAKRRDSRDNHN